MGHQTRIMYIECKGGRYVHQLGLQVPSGGELTGPGRIGRIIFSKTGKTIYYAGKTFNRWNGDKANYVCEETGESYWISGPKKRGGDSLYATNVATEIDEDVREEYWVEIRKNPDLKDQKHT
jgi:hypothetical protein